MVISVPVTGSFIGLSLGAFILVCTTTSYGLFISSMMRTQVAAVFATAVTSMIPALNFSGFLYPLSSITGFSHTVGMSFPATYFQYISLGAFTKGLHISDFMLNYVIIVGFGVMYVTLASVILQKQEK